MRNLVYLVKKHISVQLFLVITLSLGAAWLVGSGLRTPVTDTPIEIPALIQNQPQPGAVTTPVAKVIAPGQPAVAVVSPNPASSQPSALDQALRSMGTQNRDGKSVNLAAAKDATKPPVTVQTGAGK